MKKRTTEKVNSRGIVGELVNYSRPIFRCFDAARRIDTLKLDVARHGKFGN